MQYKIPQNVQREDTIIGTITFKQLAILLVGGTLTYGTYIILNEAGVGLQVWLPPVAFLGLLTLAITFLKFKDMTFTQASAFMFEYQFKPKRRIWRPGTAPIGVYSVAKQKTAKSDDESLSDRERRQKMLEVSKKLDSLSISN